MDILQNFWNQIVVTVGPFVPRVVGALVIAIIAWIIASVVKAAIKKVCEAGKVDARLKSPGIGATLASAGYWLVWLFALPMLLSTLGLSNILAPVQDMIGKLLGFLPNLLGAGVILGIGYLVAKLVRDIVIGLLTAAGSERLAARLGMAGSLGKGGLAGLLGMIVFVLILLPVVAAALQPLGLDSVTRPVTNMLDAIMGMIPRLFTAAIIILFAVIIGRLIATIAETIARGVGFDKLPQTLGLGNVVIANRSPSALVGTLVLAGIVLMAVIQASEVLGLGALTTAISGLGGVLAQVASGLIVLGIGLWLANLAFSAINGSSIANAGTLAKVARIAIMVFVIPMALRQMGVSGEIVTVGFTAIIGAAAVAAAIAFGIGGRNTAAHVLDRVTKSLEADTSALD
ncbi:MAG TPA: mechanosensitive ion channel [Thermoflexales bacterium]|nr:mechanosensitive ion channel [Thermoflexales bacterium]